MKITKKILSMLTALSLVIGVLPLYALQVVAVDAQNSNSAEPEKDWTGYVAISTKEDLAAVRNNLSGNYYLTENIVFTPDDFDVDGDFYNNGKGWEPIGNDTSAFTGVFDGNGYAISGLFINVDTTSTYAVGLFGYSSGTLKNIIVNQSNYSVNTSASGRSYVGGIVAYQDGGTISNSMSDITISATSTGDYGYPYVGGIVAYANNNTTIENCRNKGSISSACESSSYTAGIAGEIRTDGYIYECVNEGIISGGRYTGGIAGETYYATVFNCKNIGTINGAYCAGGVVGYASYDTDIYYCFNMGKVVASSTVTANSSLAYAYAGGIVGEASRGTVSNCYNTGEIEANVARTSGAKAGGILGRSSDEVTYCYNVGSVRSENEALGICASTDPMNGGSFDKCYYINTCSSGVAGGVSDTAVRCTGEQLLDKNTYIGFDFINVWQMGASNSHPYPQLISNKHNTSTSDEENTNFAGGNGTVLNPYEIATKEQLNLIRNYAAKNKWFVLVADISFDEADFSEGGSFFNDGQGWIPIGTSNEDPFTGGFDGNNHSITGLKSNLIGVGDLYVGLFGYCEGTVFDLKLVNASMSGTITGTENSVWVGGICGYLSSGTIENCSVSGRISAYETCVESQDKSKAYAGGIAGQSNNGSFNLCSNLAEVTARADSRATSSGGGSWATFAYAGGIVSKTTGTISKSFNTGRINGEALGNYAQANAGGLTASSNNNISMCYNTGMVRAMGNPNNGAAGIVASYSYGTLSNCYNTGYIAADGNVAGIIEYLSSGNVTNVYNVGEISGKTSYYVRAIIADAYSGTVKNCFYTNTKISGIRGITDTSVRLSLEDAQKQSSYTGFDFNSVWDMCDLAVHPYPELCEQNHTNIPQQENTTEFYGGTGSYFNPFKIATKEHLNNVRNYPSAYFVMVDDIQFTEDDFDANGEFYNDGAGWEPIGTSYLPFAGTFDGNGRVIKGLYVNIVVERGDICAGLFGISKGTIKNLGLANSQISASVIGTNSNYVCMAYAGGIVGENSGLIEGCYNTGSVLAFCETSQVGAGGIAGQGGNIKNCFNTGHIKAHSNGKSYSGYAGGITSNGSTIENCYNTGFVEAIAGHPSAAGITAYGSGIVSCYYLDNMEKGVASNSDPSIRCSFEEMANKDTFEGFDFSYVWEIGRNSEYLYPQLKGMPTFFKKEAIKISISELPKRITYMETKDQFAVSGGKITVGYTGGTTEENVLTADMIVDFNVEESATHIVYVNYNGLKAEFSSIVYDYLVGDISGDDSIDNLDRVNLSRFLANWDGYTEATLDMAAADINNDGQVDNLDRVILSRHLANWEGYKDLADLSE